MLKRVRHVRPPPTNQRSDTNGQLPAAKKVYRIAIDLLIMHD